jgi:hypothetical protein
MTYIITPERRAFKVSDDEFIINEHKDDESHYVVVRIIKGESYYDISPRYNISDYYHSENTEDDAVEYAKSDAYEWLVDFIMRLSTNPTVISCTDDGEIFT